jgi:hypothetical protein
MQETAAVLAAHGWRFHHRPLGLVLRVEEAHEPEGDQRPDELHDDEHGR